MPIALLFSGQGAQIVGMGRSLVDAFPLARARFEEADALLGWSLSRICFEGPAEELTKTSVCQPALYVHGYVIAEILREQGRLEGGLVAAGLSLGELTAHAVAGTFDFATGLRIVAERGRLMQEACEASQGGMASFIGGSPEEVEAVAREHDLEVANLNSPGQIVISGDAGRITAAVAAGKASGKFKMVVPLEVAGAYHSRLMEPARAAFAAFLDGIEFHAPQFPVLSNVTAEEATVPAEIKALLVRQVVAPVRWEGCLRRIVAMGCNTAFECGPKGVLAGLAKRTDRALAVTSLSEAADLTPA